MGATRDNIEHIGEDAKHEIANSGTIWTGGKALWAACYPLNEAENSEIF